MRLIPCQSSNLTGIAYEPEDSKFYVCFNGGTVYEYVELEDEAGYVQLLVANVLFSQSQGSAFSDFVKTNKHLKYRKLTDEEIADLELEV